MRPMNSILMPWCSSRPVFRCSVMFTFPLFIQKTRQHTCELIASSCYEYLVRGYSCLSNCPVYCDKSLLKNSTACTYNILSRFSGWSRHILRESRSSQSMFKIGLIIDLMIQKTSSMIWRTLPIWRRFHSGGGIIRTLTVPDHNHKKSHSSLQKYHRLTKQDTVPITEIPCKLKIQDILLRNDCIKVPSTYF